MSKKAMAACAALLVVFLGVGIFRWTSSEETAPAAAEPSSEASASLNEPVAPIDPADPADDPMAPSDVAPPGNYPYPGTPVTGNVPSENLSGPITDASVVAEQAITAYTSTTYTDPRPGAWVERMKPFTTTAFQKVLERDYANADLGLEWDQMKAEQIETRTLINSSQVSAFYDHNGADLVMVVDYTGSRRSAAVPSWTDGTGSLQKFVEMTLNDQGTWKVSDVRSTSDRRK